MMRRLVAFLRSLALLALVAVVAPAALAMASDLRFGGRQPLHGVPGPSAWSTGRIADMLTSRLTDQTIADVVIRLALVVAWSAVAVFVATVIAETAHMVRHRGHHLPDVRGLAWSQRGARTIAAGLLALLPTFSMHEPTAVASAGDAGVLGAWSTAAPVEVAPPSFETPATMPVAPVTRIDDYVVRPGDSVYGIARRIVGSDPAAVAAYADRILEANLGRQMVDGARFTNAGYIDVGWVLSLPPSGGADVTQREVTEHTVVIGESLWSIADDELGDGALWPELYRANQGHVFDDGRALDDPAVLRPGWTLVLPQASSPAAPASPVEAPTVADSASERRPPAPVPAPTTDAGDEVVHDAHHRDVLVDQAIVAAPADVVKPIPDDQSADRKLERVSAKQPVNEWAHDDAPSEREATPADAPQDPGQSSPQLLTLQRGAMLAGGVLTLLAVRRQRRLREARPRARLPEPPPRANETERALRIAGEGGRLARVDIAIRAATMSLIARDQRVLAVLCAPDGALELIATGPVTLPAVWLGGGERWILPATVPLEMLAADARQVAAPCPTLVQLGVDDRDRHVFVDLEAIGALEVSGDVQADAIVAAIAATLAGSVLAEVTTLVSVGVHADAFLGHRLHRAAPDPETAYSIAREAIGAAPPGRSRFELRARGTSGETWEPTVVLVASDAGPVAPPEPGIAVVSASPIHGPSSVLAPDGDAWVLRPVGLRLHPIGLMPDDLASIAALVQPGALMELDDDRTIYDYDYDDDDAAAGDAGVDPGPLGDTGTALAERPDWDLLVTVFGPVEVVDRDGRSVSFERSKPLELLAWMAMHRDRSTRSAARAALWANEVRDATFANVVSDARRSLARLVPSPAGEEWIGRIPSDELPLHDRIRSDADLLEHALATSRLQTPIAAIATLRRPVEAIAGPPFEGMAYLWPDAEGATSSLILLATSAAVELARHCLAVGDVDGAHRATDAGLRVLPGHQELVGLRMRAHACVDDHAAVRREWNRYEQAVNADPWSDGEASPELVELRKELLNPRR